MVLYYLKIQTPLIPVARHGVPPLQRGGMAWPTCHPPLCRGGEGEPRPHSGTLLIGEMQIILSSRKQNVDPSES